MSCNPATLGRDARILIDGGYRLTRVLPVDQFLWSAEIEVVATFDTLVVEDLGRLDGDAEAVEADIVALAAGDAGGSS